jgi:leucyl aminopeptidase
MCTPRKMTELVGVDDLDGALRGEGGWDAVVVIAPRAADVTLPGVAEPLRRAAGIDAQLGSGGAAVLPAAALAGERLVFLATGELRREQDDVRRFGDAARDALRRARDAGARAPLLCVCGVPDEPEFRHAPEAAALGALGGLWQPLEAREALGADAVEPVRRLGLATDRSRAVAPVDEALVAWVRAVEGGRRLARDLCGTEPERMAPPRFAAHCAEAFAGLPVRVEVVGDQHEIDARYPLIAAVARASRRVERHQPRIVRLEYSGEGVIERTILLAGKGLTYDTGGADLKAGGVMAGMSRDKGGAAAVAGFVHAIAALAPRGLRVVAELGVVRNSIGADSFVSDEIIPSHAGVRVRIGNTDAEGRLVLADLLSHLRERALGEPRPHVMSIATLTGHAARAVGVYSIAIDNRPARLLGFAERLAEVGDAYGDPFDVSRLRREDWDFVKPRTKADDVLSCNNLPSSATPRGHQFPMAFLAIASGLDKHGHRGADPAIAYSHIDIGGSAVEGSDWQHGAPTAAPLVALVAALAESAAAPRSTK